MRWKTWVPLAVAVVLGLTAALLVRSALSKRAAANTAAAKQIRVVVAKEGVSPGKALSAADLNVTVSPGDEQPAGTFTNVNDVVGRVVVAPLGRGQAVIEALLAPAGSVAGLAALVPEGMRAVTLEVNEVSGVAGLLVPGCRVDVVTTVRTEGSGGEVVARTIVEDVKVTAVGRRTSGGGGDEKEQQGGPKSVTVLASPREAEAIELAAATGRPRLVLRGIRDEERGGSRGVTLAELRGKPSSAAQAAPVVPKAVETGPVQRTPASRPERSVQVIRGGKESSVALEAPSAGETAVTETPVEPDGD